MKRNAIQRGLAAVLCVCMVAGLWGCRRETAASAPSSSVPVVPVVSEQEPGTSVPFTPSSAATAPVSQNTAPRPSSTRRPQNSTKQPTTTSGSTASQTATSLSGYISLTKQIDPFPLLFTSVKETDLTVLYPLLTQCFGEKTPEKDYRWRFSFINWGRKKDGTAGIATHFDVQAVRYIEGCKTENYYKITFKYENGTHVAQEIKYGGYVYDPAKAKPLREPTLEEKEAFLEEVKEKAIKAFEEKKEEFPVMPTGSSLSMQEVTMDCFEDNEYSISTDTLAMVATVDFYHNRGSKQYPFGGVTYRKVVPR